MGHDVLSPPAHSAFGTPDELLEFVETLREASGGKPVGIKLCVGVQSEFMALAKAMVRSDRHPDYIAVDGGEGGTGAAPLEFSNSVGSPLADGLVFVHNCLVGFGLRERVRVIASGKIATGFQLVSRLALGADACASARSMMLALGCIQARRCNANDCPVGVATQKENLVGGLDVEDKAQRVQRYHAETLDSALELLAAAGLSSPSEASPEHILRRTGPTEVKSYFELYPFLEKGALLFEPVPTAYEEAWRASSPDSFRPRGYAAGSGPLSSVTP